jgi:putative ABC transport system permease protein
VNDVRFAFRQLGKSPGFTIVTLLTLTIGIGACTAIFSVVNRVLLQPLPYPHPEQLVHLSESNPPNYPQFSVAPGNLFDWQKRSTTFSSIAAIQYTAVNLTGSGEPARVGAGRVTLNYLATLGVHPALGRDFVSGEDAPVGEIGQGQGPDVRNGAVAIVGEGFWARQFGRRQDVIGQVIHVDGNPVTIIGVMPRDFHGQDIMLPTGFTADKDEHGGHFVDAYGRMKPGVTVEQARGDLVRVAKGLEKEFPNTNTGWTVKVVSMQEDMVGYVRPQLYSLLAAVGFLLFIGCANVANLLLIRAAARSREMAVRAAIGASRLRIVRQLLVENLILAVLGGACGALAAYWGLHLLLALAPDGVPRSGEISIDGIALAFSVALALVTGLGFGVAPALQAARVDLNTVLKDASRGSSEGRGHHRLRNVLVAAELMIAVVLLVGAGLLMQTFTRLIKINPGFQTNSAVMVDLTLPSKKYAEPAKQAAFAVLVNEQLERIPGVTSSGVSQVLPFHSDYNLTFDIEGRTFPPGQNPGDNYYAVSPGYFKAMGIPVLRGRGFTDADSPTGPLVSVVSESMARRFFPNENPIGKRINVQNGPGKWSEIIGIVGDVKQYGLTTDAPAETYEPFAQHPFPFQTFVVRTTGDVKALSGAVRGAVVAVDSEQPVDSIIPLTDLVRGSVGNQHFAMNLFMVFSGAALLLATLGIYGVMSYSVTQRTGEIGVRMALGAQTRDVLWMVVRQGVLLIAIGIAGGLVGAVLLTRFIASMLYGVGAADPLTLAAASLTLGIAAFAACLLSARRATRIDPITALRGD